MNSSRIKASLGGTPTLALLLVIFAGLARHTLAMTLTSHQETPAAPAGRTAHGSSTGPMVPLGIAIFIVAIIGFLAASSEVITLSLVVNVTSSRGGGQELAGSRVRAAQILGVARFAGRHCFPRTG